MEHYVLVPHHGRGRGRLARHGRAAVFCVADSSAAAPLVGWCRLVGERPAEAALAELQRLGASPGIVALSAMVFDDAGVTVLLYGGVPLVAEREGERHRVANNPGEPPAIVSLGDVTTLELHPSDEADDPLLDLASGVLPADGFTLRHVMIASAPWQVPPTELAAADAEGAAVEPEESDVESPEPEVPDDLPTAPMASLRAAALPSQVTVLGLRCPRGHFNDPRHPICTVCGAPMHETTFVLTEGTRPPLGILVFADGSQHVVDGDVLVGRDPDEDDRVRAGELAALSLTDPANTVSRVHAEVRCEEWDVMLVDRRSTNGTFVWIAEQQRWERLAPGEPRALEPGAQLAFGRLTATFESSSTPG